MNFVVPADHRKKLKNLKREISTRELKKTVDMKVTIIPVVIGALGIVTKGLVQGLEDLEITERVETFQAAVLLRFARIQRRVQETWEDLLSLKLQWKTIS